jgi:MFS family permease
MVSHARIVRPIVLLGFAAAASYVAARLLSTTPGTDANLGSLWDPSVLLSWIAVLVLCGAIVVPALRALRTKRIGRKLLLGMLALLLLAGTLLLPILFAHYRGKLGFAQIVATPGAGGISHGLDKTVLAVILGTPPLVALTAIVFPWRQKMQRVLDKYLPLPALMAIVSAVVLAWSIHRIYKKVHWNWTSATVISAAAALCIFAIYLGFGMFKRPKRPITL